MNGLESKTSPTKTNSNFVPQKLNKNNVNDQQTQQQPLAKICTTKSCVTDNTVTNLPSNKTDNLQLSGEQKAKNNVNIEQINGNTTTSSTTTTNNTKNQEPSGISSPKGEQELAANNTLGNTTAPIENSTAETSAPFGNSTFQNDQLMNNSTQVNKTVRKFEFDVPTYGWKRNSIGLTQLVKKGIRKIFCRIFISPHDI